MARDEASMELSRWRRGSQGGSSVEMEWDGDVKTKSTNETIKQSSESENGRTSMSVTNGIVHPFGGIILQSKTSSPPTP